MSRQNGVKALKISGVVLTLLGVLFTAFLAHDARYALADDVKALRKGITKQTAEVKLIVLENRRLDLEQRVYELEAARERTPLSETSQERLAAFTRELRHLIERIGALQKQVDAPD